VRRLITTITKKTYSGILKPVFFRTDPQKVHIGATAFGEKLGQNKRLRKIISSQFKITNSVLHQELSGINFPNPIGLAAGFDYETRLTQITLSVGFGFQTVGTITNMAYEGNPRPQLGRLPKSKSLMVIRDLEISGQKKLHKH